MADTKTLIIKRETAIRILSGKAMDAEAVAEVLLAFDAPRSPESGDVAVVLATSIADSWRDAIKRPEVDLDAADAVRLTGAFALTLGGILEVDRRWQPKF